MFSSEEVGHTKRSCPQDIMEVEQVTISCKLCGEEGHRVRDCTQERQKPRAPRTCKVCESEDHIAKECPNREKRTCHKCGSEDHMAKDCDIIKCTNWYVSAIFWRMSTNSASSEAEGHTWRDCTQPKDWSKVKCRNCGEMGHTHKRCKQPLKEELQTGGATGGAPAGATGGSGGFETADAGATAGGGWEAADATTSGAGQNDWETSSTVAVTAGGKW